MRRTLIVFALLLACTLLAACGNKGPLVRASHAGATAQAPAGSASSAAFTR